MCLKPRVEWIIRWTWLKVLWVEVFYIYLKIFKKFRLQKISFTKIKHATVTWRSYVLSNSCLDCGDLNISFDFCTFDSSCSYSFTLLSFISISLFIEYFVSLVSPLSNVCWLLAICLRIKFSFSSIFDWISASGNPGSSPKIRG